MTEFLNWIFTLAYFTVFLIGMLTCVRNTQSALRSRQTFLIPNYNKHQHTFKAFANSTIAVLGILGLIRAFIGA